ncbi:MAG: hypothetical protein QW761_01975 [Candidatus Aenigmatarchaeota archaeon]
MRRSIAKFYANHFGKNKGCNGEALPKDCLESDPSYKILLKTFRQTGLDKIFPHYEECIKDMLVAAYNTAMSTDQANEKRWRGQWVGQKFQRHVAKLALDEFLSKVSITYDSDLTKDMVKRPRRYKVNQHGNPLTVNVNGSPSNSRVLATISDNVSLNMKSDISIYEQSITYEPMLGNMVVSNR